MSQVLIPNNDHFDLKVTYSNRPVGVCAGNEWNTVNSFDHPCDLIHF